MSTPTVGLGGTQWYVELSRYDTDLDAEQTAYLCTGGPLRSGYVSSPTSTPASTPFRPVVTQPAKIRRDMFGQGTTMGRSVIGLGELRIKNDGEFDAWRFHAFAGWSLIERFGDEFAVHYPVDLTTFLRGVIAQQPDLDAEEVVFKIRDRQAELDLPIQDSFYLGDGDPDGLEGDTEIAGKPKPLLFGYRENISPVCVNKPREIYQWNDGESADLSDVRIGGVSVFSAIVGWTTRASGFGASAIRGAGYSDVLGRWCIVGDGGKVATSDDNGATWTMRTGAFGTDQLFGVIWAKDQFVAFGQAGGGLQGVMTSPTGVSWTRHSTLGSIQAMAYSPGLDCLIGVDGGSVISQSTDGGGSWLNVTPGGAGSSITGVAWGQNLFVVVGADGTISTSPDGFASWTVYSIGLAAFNPQPYNIVFANATFIIVAQSGTLGIPDMLLISHSGLEASWAHKDGPVSDQNNSLPIAYDGRLLMVPEITGSQPIIYVSENLGNSWTASDSGFGGSDIHVAAAANGVFIVAGDAGKLVTATPPQPIYYASAADILDDAQQPGYGEVGIWLGGSMFRLGFIPIADITCDARQSLDGCIRDTTASDIFEQVMDRMGKAGEYDTGDTDALRSANGSDVGDFIHPNDGQVTAATVLDRVMGGVGAWWGADSLGVFRTARLEDPTFGTSVRTFLPEHQVGSTGSGSSVLNRLPLRDPGEGQPFWRVRVRYARNNTIQRTLLEEASTDARARWGGEWLEVFHEDGAIKAKYPFSEELVIDAGFNEKEDAQDECDRVFTLRSVARERYEFKTPIDEDLLSVLELGRTVTVVNSRFQLADGQKFDIITLEPDAEKKLMLLGVWG